MEIVIFNETMTEKNTVLELEAEFSLILDRVLSRRGKERKKHIKKLKEFVSEILYLTREVTEKHTQLEIGNLELEIMKLKREKGT